MVYIWLHLIYANVTFAPLTCVFSTCYSFLFVNESFFRQLQRKNPETHACGFIFGSGFSKFFKPTYDMNRTARTIANPAIIARAVRLFSVNKWAEELVMMMHRFQRPAQSRLLAGATFVPKRQDLDYGQVFCPLISIPNISRIVLGWPSNETLNETNNRNSCVTSEQVISTFK